MTRREQALQKIHKLERKLDMGPSDSAGTRIEREICRLQQTYGITLEEIQGPKDYAKMFPFLSEEVVQTMERGKVIGNEGKR